jgi:hypothetical protein
VLPPRKTGQSMLVSAAILIATTTQHLATPANAKKASQATPTLLAVAPTTILVPFHIYSPC